MHFSLVLLDKPNGDLVKAFDDVILPVYFALRRLGYEAEILRHQANPNSRNLIFGAAVNPGLGGLDFPPDSVLINLEQLSAANSNWGGQDYLDCLKRFEVWDYSPRNIEHLRAAGLEAAFLQLGYVPEMTRLARGRAAGHDVLFYGLASPRRQAVLDELKSGGARINQPPPTTFGRDRDLAIADSRLYLNIHHYLPATLEVVRLGYLWANHMPVVSELRPDTELYPGLEEACLYSPYENLAGQTRELLADEARLQAQARAGFEAFQALSLEKSLENLVGRRAGAVRPVEFHEPRPRIINAGCGRDFQNQALNIDLNPASGPDLELDLAQPLEPGQRYRTDRFGEIELSPESFESIIAFDLLDRVSNLRQLMDNFLSLLEENGRLTLTVPYYLSGQAWQSPDQVRAFSEKSWQAYSRGGPRESRFEMEECLFMLSGLGRKMLARGASREKLARSPRAVDGLRVTLRKRRTTEKEKAAYDQARNDIYLKTGPNWVCFAAGHDEPRPVFSGPADWWRGRLRLTLVGFQYRFYKIMSRLGLFPGRSEAWKKKRADLRAIVGQGLMDSGENNG